MPYAARTLPSPQALTRAQQKALKVVFFGLAYVAGLVLITMAQITLDRMATDVDPDRTAIGASAE